MKRIICQPIWLCNMSSPIYGRWEVTFVDNEDDFVCYSYYAKSIVQVEKAAHKANGFKGYTKIELVGFTVNEQYFILEESNNSGYDLGIVLNMLK